MLLIWSLIDKLVLGPLKTLILSLILVTVGGKLTSAAIELATWVTIQNVSNNNTLNDNGSYKLINNSYWFVVLFYH